MRNVNSKKWPCLFEILMFVCILFRHKSHLQVRHNEYSFQLKKNALITKLVIYLSLSSEITTTISNAYFSLIFKWGSYAAYSASLLVSMLLHEQLWASRSNTWELQLGQEIFRIKSMDLWQKQSQSPLLWLFEYFGSESWRNCLRNSTNCIKDGTHPDLAICFIRDTILMH